MNAGQAQLANHESTPITPVGMLPDFSLAAHGHGNAAVAFTGFKKEVAPAGGDAFDASPSGDLLGEDHEFVLYAFLDGVDGD